MTREAVETIEDVVKNIIVAELRVEREQLEPATHLMKDLGADSLDALNIALRLEETFKIKIPDDAILFPGHQYSMDPSSSMGETRQMNYVFRPKSAEQWLTMFGN